MKRRIGIFKKSLGIMSVLIGLVLVVGFASQAHATPTISVTKLCENAAGPGQRIVFLWSCYQYRARPARFSYCSRRPGRDGFWTYNSSSG